MNFDFSEKEHTFFADLRDLMEDFIKDREPETSDAVAAEKAARELLGGLAGTPYLEFGLSDGQKDWGGMLTLMPAMETVARYCPSLLLTVEMSTRVFGRILARWGSERQRLKILEPL